MALATSSERNLKASVSPAAECPPAGSVRAASNSPSASHQLGNSFCSVNASRAKVRSNQAADIASARGWATSDQPSQIAIRQATPTAIERACSRSRGSQATSVMQQMPPTAAGIVTKAIMKGSSSA